MEELNTIDDIEVQDIANEAELIEERVTSKTSITSSYKEIEISLNTLTSGEAEFISPKISGMLECVIIQRVDTTIVDPLQIKVGMVNEGIEILDIPQFIKTKYLPVRIETVYKTAKGVSEYNVARYCMNGPLYFYINGAKESSVKFIVRYKK